MVDRRFPQGRIPKSGIGAMVVDISAPAGAAFILLISLERTTRSGVGVRNEGSRWRSNEIKEEEKEEEERDEMDCHRW